MGQLLKQLFKLKETIKRILYYLWNNLLEIFAIIFGLLGFIILIAIAYLLFYGLTEDVNNSNLFGNYGALAGGFAGSIFSLVSALLFYSVLKNNQKQTELIFNQSFDDRFFKMISFLKEVKNQYIINYEDSYFKRYSANAFYYIDKPNQHPQQKKYEQELKELYNARKKRDVKKINGVCNLIMNTLDIRIREEIKSSPMEDYLTIIKQILGMIKHSSINRNKEFYHMFLRSQLGEDEKAFLFYKGLLDGELKSLIIDAKVIKRVKTPELANILLLCAYFEDITFPWDR